MIDLAFELLKERINIDSAGVSLWVVDENSSNAEIVQILPRPNLFAVTNRFDVYKKLLDRGIQAVVNDFDFSFLETIDSVFFRVSKEKAIVHHVINCSMKRLGSGGLLALTGYKNEGIKTYIEKTSLLFDSSPIKNKGGKTSMLGQFRKNITPRSDLDSKSYLEDRKFLEDKDYKEYREVEGVPDLITKPGVYGWNKIDKGSAFLIDNLPNFLNELKSKPNTVVDLGCGYGYISVMANKILPVRYLATDNNVAAVEVCKLNFNRNAVDGDVLLGDCADSLSEQVDLVLCNPPFHQGFDVDGDLTTRFIHSAKKLLKNKGSAFFVVNSFIPLEKKAEGIFSSVKQLENNGSFKLIALSNNKN